MKYDIGYNIINITNELSFAYQGLAPELQVFVSPLTESIKAADFICVLEEKQEVWYKMMTILIKLQKYYNPVQKLSPYRPLLPSQSKAFSYYQSQHQVPQSQQPWWPSEWSSDLKQSVSYTKL